jgi:flagellar motor switch protein FliM
VNEILNNEEIDTLLAMFRAEGAAEEGGGTVAALAAESPVERVSQVDLLKPNRLAREQLRGLERYFDGAAKLLSSTIAEKLRLDTRCDCVAVEQTRFRTWLEQLPGPTAIYVVGMQPFELPALFTASTSLLYGAVDRILGGSGRVKSVPKDFTQAEYTVADALIGPCLDRIVESLADVVALRWTVQNRFCNPSMAQILPSQDVVLSVYFQVAGEFLIGDMRLLLPFAALEPHIARLGNDAVTRLAPGAMREAVARAMRHVPLDLGVELGNARIRLRQLLDLQAGDVVTLDTRLGAPAVIPIQGRPKFHGHVGRIGNRYAFRIADVLGD